MSTITASGPAIHLRNQEATRVSPVDYVRSLPLEDQEEIFVALLRDVIAFNGGKGLIPIETPDGDSLGYFVPPEAADARAEGYLPKFTPEEEAELARRHADPGPSIPIQDWIEELNARADALQRQQQ